MTDINIQDMMDAGAHFGHQTRRWNPKMKPYIYGSRSGVHILDLGQTHHLAQSAVKKIEKIVASGQNVLFVGTKPQAQEVIEEQARACHMPFVTRRWLGGMLTNYQTIKKSVDRLLDLEGRRERNDFEGFTKRELIEVDREIIRLSEYLGGIKEMKGLPGAIFVIDPSIEKIAVHEANVLNIPVIALTDSNCDPDPIDFVIPSNDDAQRCIYYFTSKIAGACLAGLEKREANFREEDAGDAQPRRRGRRAQVVEGGAAKGYVSKPEASAETEGVQGFSASAEKAKEVSRAEEVADSSGE